MAEETQLLFPNGHAASIDAVTMLTDDLFLSGSQVRRTHPSRDTNTITHHRDATATGLGHPMVRFPIQAFRA